MTAPEPRGGLLLVEDDAVFAGVLSRALKRRGFEVVCTATAADAVKCSHVMPWSISSSAKTAASH